MMKVSDENNWENNSLFREVFLHNVLDIPIEYNGTEKDFKEKLEKRWRKYEK
jgi:hypothetical protein